MELLLIGLEGECNETLISGVSYGYFFTFWPSIQKRHKFWVVFFGFGLWMIILRSHFLQKHLLVRYKTRKHKSGHGEWNLLEDDCDQCDCEKETHLSCRQSCQRVNQNRFAKDDKWHFSFAKEWMKKDDSYLNRLLYWVDTASKKIEMSWMDGTNIKTVAAGNLLEPTGEHLVVCSQFSFQVFFGEGRLVFCLFFVRMVTFLNWGWAGVVFSCTKLTKKLLFGLCQSRTINLEIPRERQ